MLITKLRQFLSDSPLSNTQKNQLLTLIQQLNATDHHQQQFNKQIQELINELHDSFIVTNKNKNLESSLKTDQDTTMASYDSLPDDLRTTLDQISVAPTLSATEDTHSQSFLKHQDRITNINASSSTAFIENTEYYRVSLPQEKRIGKYIDLGILGEGGMGEVRKVKDETLKRTLAMKIMHPQFNHNQNAIIRFMEEAQVGGPRLARPASARDQVRLAGRRAAGAGI